MAADESKGGLGPMDFSTFIISLGSSVMMQLGDPTGADAAPDEAAALDLARQTIDILAMLETKTAGNLTDEEASLLRGVLYQARMAFIEASKR